MWVERGPREDPAGVPIALVASSAQKVCCGQYSVVVLVVVQWWSGLAPGGGTAVLQLGSTHLSGNNCCETVAMEVRVH